MSAHRQFLKILHSKVDQDRDKWVANARPSVSCRKGCSACCEVLVLYCSLGEALGLVAEVDATGQTIDAEALEAAMAGYRAAPRAADYIKHAKPCPLLREKACTVYEARPMTCRNYLVTTPAESCGSGGAVQSVEIPGLHDRAQEASRDMWQQLGIPHITGPLPMMLAGAMYLAKHGKLPSEVLCRYGGVCTPEEWVERWGSFLQGAQ